MTSIDEAFEEAAGPRLGQHKTRLRRALESPVLTSTQSIVGLSILGFFVVVALTAPLWIHGDVRQKVGPVFAPPSSNYWLGTVGGGADML